MLSKIDDDLWMDLDSIICAYVGKETGNLYLRFASYDKEFVFEKDHEGEQIDKILTALEIYATNGTNNFGDKDGN